MSAATVPGRKTAIAVGVAGLAVGLLFMLNQPSGPIGETTGVVQSHGFLPRDTGPPPQVASVRLSDGAVVQAELLTGVLVKPGQVARLRVFRRVISGTPYYQLVAMDAKK